MPQSFPKVRLIAVGKIKKSWTQEGLQLYLKRLPELEIQEIKDSDPEREGRHLLSLVKPTERLIALSEEGQQLTSVELAELMAIAASGSLVFAIGGPDGLSAEVKSQAARLLSLSAMTLPHELARLVLVEQLYRAKSILQQSPYHR